MDAHNFSSRLMAIKSYLLQVINHAVQVHTNGSESLQNRRQFKVREDIHSMDQMIIQWNQTLNQYLNETAIYVNSSKVTIFVKLLLLWVFSAKLVLFIAWLLMEILFYLKFGYMHKHLLLKNMFTFICCLWLLVLDMRIRFKSDGYSNFGSFVIFAITITLKLLITFILQVWFAYLCKQFVFEQIDRFREYQKTVCRRVYVDHSEKNHFLTNGDFTISNEVIGSYGPYSTVYKCSKKVIKQGLESIEPMAVKVIDMPKLRKQLEFLAEEGNAAAIDLKINTSINTLCLFEHNSIVKCEKAKRWFDNIGLNSKLFLFSKLADNNLDNYLTRDCPTGIDEDLARFWMRQLCEAVNYLHNQFNSGEGIAHSNIKPENALLFKRTQAALNGRAIFDVKLADTGMHSLYESSGKITTKQNPYYIISPPEFVFGTLLALQLNTSDLPKESLLAGDVFSLGVVLVLMIEGDIRKVVGKPEPYQKESAKYDFQIDGIFVKINSQNVNHLLGPKISALLLDLLKSMLDVRPVWRSDIGLILKHQWFTND